MGRASTIPQLSRLGGLCIFHLSTQAVALTCLCAEYWQPIAEAAAGILAAQGTAGEGTGLGGTALEAACRGGTAWHTHIFSSGANFCMKAGRAVLTCKPLYFCKQLQAVAELMQVSSNKSPWGLPTGACWFERYETHSWRRHSWRGHARTELQHSRRLKWHSEVATDRARITSCHLQAARGWVVV